MNEPCYPELVPSRSSYDMRLCGSCLPRAQPDGPCPLESLQLGIVLGSHTQHPCKETKDMETVNNNAVAQYLWGTSHRIEPESSNSGVTFWFPSVELKND